ncbi:MAG TPA: hypothetical protein VF785_24420 [Gemmatimonadaceae bacterium]
MALLNNRGVRAAWICTCWFGIVSLVTGASVAAAQEKAGNGFNLDKLEITSLGASIGRILPSQVEPTTLYAVQADYGDIVPGWHIVFGTSYWESRFRDAVVQAFVDSLTKSLVDPTGTAKIALSRVTLYDVTFGTELRYTPVYSGEIKPFIGAGLAAHVINAEGKLIKGTFVERSLDDIAAGLFITGGVSFKLLKHIGVEGTLRGDLLSGFRSSQARVGGTYYFGRMHARGPGG